MTDTREKLSHNIEVLRDLTEANPKGIAYNGAKDESWSAWGKHVLITLEVLSGEVALMRDSLHGIELRMVLVEERTKSSAKLYGLIGGAIPAAVIVLCLIAKEFLLKR